jgi:hypothetical protein
MKTGGEAATAARAATPVDAAAAAAIDDDELDDDDNLTRGRIGALPRPRRGIACLEKERCDLVSVATGAERATTPERPLEEATEEEAGKRKRRQGAAAATSELTKIISISDFKARVFSREIHSRKGIQHGVRSPRCDPRSRLDVA